MLISDFWSNLCRRYLLLPVVCALIAQIICTHHVVADEVVVLTNGSTIFGKILNPSDSPRKTWQIQPAKGVVVELRPREAVQHVPMQNAAVSQYFDRVPFFPESVENHLKLAELCNSQKLSDFTKLHYERVLELDPDNSTARQALNHRKIGDEWVSYEDEMLRKGYVKTQRGNWTTPQQLLIDERQVRTEGQSDESTKYVQDIVAKLKTPNAKEAELALYALKDPAAVSVLTQALKSEQESGFRDIYIRALAKIGTSQAYYGISQWVMQEPNEEVCWTCIAMMRSVPGMSKYIIPYLGHRENVMVNRAAYILGQLGDRAAVPALINVLITEHKVDVRRGDPNLSQYTGLGNNSFAGQQNLKPETATELVSNREVLIALESLTSENFRYDIPAWQNWWAGQNRVTEFDSRRGSYDH